MYIIPQLDLPVPEERPSFYSLQTLLVLGTPELVTIKILGGTRAFPRGVLSGPLCGELFQSHHRILGCLLAVLLYRREPDA